jgi:thiol-disulfide isomerase/thioredoxin
MIRAIATTGALAAAALALAACDPPESTTYRPLRAGDAAPAYSAVTLAGDTVALESLRGAPVMLNVWATWCIPCRDEMPLLEALHREYAPHGLRVVGVSVDATGMVRDIEAFLADVGVTFTILHDPAERFTRAFRTIGVPETFLIDRDGVVVRRWIGKFDPLAEDVRRDVRRTLEAA